MKNIASALVKAQKSFAPALKTSTNPHYRSKYADLSACVEAVIDSLNANGIALIQQTHESESGVTVETMFLHESGETLSCGKLHVPASKQDPQGYGSALTYARRYSLMAACGIAPEDDDGNAAKKKDHPMQPKESAKTVAASTLKSMPEDQQDHIKNLAIDIVAAFESSDEEGFNAYTGVKSTLDADQQVALWGCFTKEMKSKIKSIGEKHV